MSISYRDAPVTIITGEVEAMIVVVIGTYELTPFGEKLSDVLARAADQYSAHTLGY
jgi:hypothetical protein